MKSIIITTIALLVINMGLTAQDFIYKKDGGRIKSVVLDIQVNNTNYYNFGDESKAVHTISNNDISFIAYENGSIKFFESKGRSEQRYNYKKNLINYHLFDLIVNNFKISYERIISKGKLGIQIPVAIGYGDGISGYDDVQNDFYTGVTLNFYPTGQGKVRYFMGPSLLVGSGHYENNYYDYNNWVYQKYDTFVLRFLVNNGIIFSPIPELSLSAVGSIGIVILIIPALMIMMILKLLAPSLLIYLIGFSIKCLA